MMKFYVVVLFAYLTYAEEAEESDENQMIGGQTNSTDLLMSYLKKNHAIMMKSRDLLSDGKRSKKMPKLHHVRNRVADDNQVYSIDFTDTKGTEDEAKVKESMMAEMGVYFPCDLLITSKYNGKVMFTPIKDIRNPNFPNLDQTEEVSERDDTAKDPDVTEEVPNVMFYLDFQHSIKPEDCQFEKSPSGFKDDTPELRDFCENPRINLRFLVDMKRSSKTTNAADEKIVRITLNKGNGFYLHSTAFVTQEVKDKQKKKLYGAKRDWSTSAIAKQYIVEFDATNEGTVKEPGFATISSTCPKSNVNEGEDEVRTSSHKVGRTVEFSLTKLVPTFKWNTNKEDSETRQITVKTTDYKLIKQSGIGVNSVKFVMERIHNASSILTKEGSKKMFWQSDEEIPIDTSKIKPIGYAGFLPNYDVIYSAFPKMTETTKFSLKASVLIMPLYFITKKIDIGVAQKLKYTSLNPNRLTPKEAGDEISFDVNWNHVVFTGQKPVELQFKGNQFLCITDKYEVEIKDETTCSPLSKALIYDSDGRYKSARNTNKCLDGSTIGVLKNCSSAPSQTWKWDEANKYIITTNKKLGVKDSKPALVAKSETKTTEVKSRWSKLYELTEAAQRAKMEDVDKLSV